MLRKDRLCQQWQVMDQVVSHFGINIVVVDDHVVSVGEAERYEDIGILAEKCGMNPYELELRMH